MKALFPHRSMGTIKINAHKRGLKVDADKLELLRHGPCTVPNSWRAPEDTLITSLITRC